MDCLSRHSKLPTEGADAWSQYAMNGARIMRVMTVRAHARVAVFEKAHALMKRIHITCNGKYVYGNC